MCMKYAIAGCFFTCLAGLNAEADNYRVSISDSDVRLAHIEATIVPDANVIAMNDEGNQGLKEGWSTFVKNLRVTDHTGRVLSTQYERPSRWRLQNYKSGPVTLSYDVELKHDKAGLNFGDNGAAYANDFGVMWAGRALFIAGKETSDVTVQFDLPKSWHITTPWTSKNASTNTFTTLGSHDLVNSAFFAGTHTTFNIAVESASIRITLAGENVMAMRDDLSELTGKYLRYYNKTFGPARPTQMLLIASDASYWGGEVMGRVISLSVAGKPREGFNPLQVLGHVIAHEIYHLWNSNVKIDEKIHRDFEWFNEGFTAEYASWTAALRLGDIDEATFLNQLSEDWRKYAAKLDGQITLTSAGAQKEKYYDLVYSGGMIAAAALDIQIRHDSGNLHSLDTLITELLKRFPRRPNDHKNKHVESITLDKLIDVVRSLYGNKIASTLETYIRQPDLIPLQKIVMLAGLDAKSSQNNKSLKISATPNPTPQQRTVWKGISGQ